MKSSRIIKIIGILCLALLTAAILILRNNPATKFESSIYTVTPSIVWVIIIFCVICGLGIILHQVYYRRETGSNLWVIGLVIIVFSFTIVFSAHALRAYAFYGRGDALSHLGIARNIIQTGKTDVFYPALHILTAQLSLITGTSLARIFSFLPASFAGLFVVCMYFFTRTVLPHKGQAILATITGILALSTGANGPVYATPNALADMLVPLIFFFCLIATARRSSGLKIPFILLLTILIFLLPVFHPVPTLAVLLLMLALWLPAEAYNLWGKKQAFSIPSTYPRTSLPALILFIWSTFWISSFYIWESAIRNIYVIISEGGPNQFDALRNTIEFAAGYGYSVVEQFLKRYIDIAIVSLLAAAAFPLVLKRIAARKELDSLFALYGPLFIFAAIIIVLLFFNIQFGPARMLRYLEITGAVFAGYIIFEALKRLKNSQRGLFKLVSLILIVALLALLQVNGVLRSHYSRYTFTPPSHVTESEMRGVSWFFQHKDRRVSASYSTIAPRRFADLLLSPEEKAQRPDINVTEYPTIPWHFYYDTADTLGRAYEEDTYMVISDNDRLQYVEVYPEVAEFRFYPADFKKLVTDPSLDRLYTNSNLVVWKIHPVPGSP